MRPVGAATIVLLCGLLPLSGCASLWHGTSRAMDRAPNGLSRPDDNMRRALVAGSFAVAVRQAEATKHGAPNDRLLRALYQGTAYYYAGDYAHSVGALLEADQLIERRFTKSLSAGALALVTNDMAMPYFPSRTEQLFVRYYAMMARARMGDADAAAVEARRLGYMLEDDARDLNPDERSLHAVLRDAAGAVFESVGETNDALVSYRNAARLRGAMSSDIDTIQLTAPHADSATVVVLIESGFVAHRVDQQILVPISDNDGRMQRSPARNAGRWVRIGWPALRRTAMPTAQVAMVVNDVRIEPTGHAGDVSMAIEEDLRRAKPAMVARMAARAAARTAVTRVLDDDHQWIGSVINLAGNMVERADTRSWQLLPGNVRTVKITVPAGTHDPVLQIGDAFERITIALPRVHATAGSVTVLDARVWRDASGMVAASAGVP